MKRNAILPLFFCTLMSCAAAQTPVPSGAPSADSEIPGPDTRPFAKATDFYQIHLYGLYYIHSELPYQYPLSGKEDVRKFREKLEKEARAAARLKEVGKDAPNSASSQAPDQEAAQFGRFERYALANFTRYSIKYSLAPPSRQELESVLKRYAERFPTEESVVAQAIFVEIDDEITTAAAREIATRLQERLRQGEPFQAVARDYYESRGEPGDGTLGRLVRGRYRDDIFNLFMAADIEAPCFGPVSLGNGLLLGKALKRYPGGDVDPVEYYKEDLLALWREETMRKRVEEITEAMARKLKAVSFPLDEVNSRTLSLPAYEIPGDGAVTFGEAVKRLPMLMGDQRDPRFYLGVAKKALANDLLGHSPEAAQARQSEAFAFLARAHRNAARVDRAVRERMSREAPSEDKLHQYYQEHAASDYARSDMVRLLVVRMPWRETPKGMHPREAHAMRKEDFNAARRARARFQDDPSTQTLLHLADYSGCLALTWSADARPRPVSELGRVLERGVKSLAAGQISEVLMDDDACLIARVLERSPRPPKSFSEIREQVLADYLQHQESEVRKEILAP